MTDRSRHDPWIELDGEQRPRRDGFRDPSEPGRAPAEIAGPPTRRGFLKALALSAASLAGCERLPVRRAIPYLVPPEEITPGVPTLYASTCSACPAGCGLVARVLDGRPVKLEGNPEHAGSRGGLCALAQADLRALYDPERLRFPQMAGARTDWSALDAAVRSRLADVRDRGLDVVFASPTITSPTAREAVEEFLAPYGGRLVEHDLDPQCPSAILEADLLLGGSGNVPASDLERVDLLIAFGSDLFGTGPDPVTDTAAWAARRRHGEMAGPPRHVQIEGSLSLTGANADERWISTSAGRQHIALWMLRRLAERLEVTGAAEIRGTLGDLTPIDEPDRLEALVEALVAVPGRSLIVSSSDDLAEQVAVGLANRLLGNEGRTLDRRRPLRLRRGLDRQLDELREGLAAGTVGAAIIAGLDLVGRLPDGDAIGNALRSLPLAVGIFTRPTATSVACDVVAAAHHGLECWADMQPRAGTRTLAQPAVRPLFDTRDPWESVLAWSSDATGTWHDRLRERWGGNEDPEGWVDAVRSAGIVGSTATPPETSGTAAVPALAPEAHAVLAAATGTGRASDAGAIEVEIMTEVSCRGVDHAANPWLRELPDPLTRVAWAPCARIGPARATAEGILDGDLVEVDVAGASVTLPACVVPGQHPDVVALSVGYPANEDNGAEPGREATSDLLRYVELDGHSALRWRGLRGALRPTGRRGNLPRIQVHALTEGRPIVHQVGGHDETVHGAHHPDVDLWPERQVTSPHWEMVIDLDACVGCAGCVVACQAENNLPVVGETQMEAHRDMHWLRIDRYFVGDPDDPEVLFEPMLCAQCDHAPCETVCPVAATVHSEDGLNQQVYNRCVGTRYCANNCPYKVRRFNWFDFQPSDPIERLVLNPDVVVRTRGVMEKCTFCVQRIQSARIAARRDGAPSFEVTTACQQSCPAQAIHFGDATDEEGEITRLKHKSRAFQVLAELGVEPSISYLARVRQRSGDSESAASDTDAHGGDA